MEPSAEPLSPDEAPVLRQLRERELHRVEHPLMAFLHVARVVGSLRSRALEVDRFEDVDEDRHGQGEEGRRPHGEPPGHRQNRPGNVRETFEHLRIAIFE